MAKQKKINNIKEKISKKHNININKNIEDLLTGNKTPEHHQKKYKKLYDDITCLVIYLNIK